jgi:hypothetical protein
MIQHAEAANACLREIFPTGYALDATHRPHITILQRFVYPDRFGDPNLLGEMNVTVTVTLKAVSERCPPTQYGHRAGEPFQLSRRAVP